MKTFLAFAVVIPMMAGGQRDDPAPAKSTATTPKPSPTGSTIAAQKPAPPTTPPPASEKKASQSAPPASEQLTYVINWPTGLSLGEAHLRTTREKVDGADRWDTDFTMDASLPALKFIDKARSLASPDFCSQELDKSYTHGHRNSEEKTIFDQEAKIAKRGAGPGRSEMNLTSCAKDALAFLQYLRRELSEGRLPPHQVVYYGAPYRVSVQFKNTEKIALGEQKVDADHLLATIKGPTLDITCDLFFSKDSTRTPLLIKVPTSLATFSMELVR